MQCKAPHTIAHPELHTCPKVCHPGYPVRCRDGGTRHLPEATLGIVTSPHADTPALVLVTGLQGTGKSNLRDGLLRPGPPTHAHDWALSGLRPFPEIQAALGPYGPPGHARVPCPPRALAESHSGEGRPQSSTEWPGRHKWR